MSIGPYSSGTLNTIAPLNLPDAAGYLYSGGDVEHMTPTASMDWATLSNTSRELAARDNLIASKLEEVIANVNNNEQLIPVNVPRTYLGQGDSIDATTVRIPTGFEARVLNGAVSGTPISNTCLLTIYYSANFGDTSGQSVASTYTETSASTNFYPAGEFVINISNAGTQGITAVASVLITLRPVSPQAGSLIGPGVPGEQGPPGPPGADGQDGGPGPPGQTGAVGLIWQGQYNPTTPYAAGVAVYVNLGTSGIASYFSLAPSTGVTPPLPSLAPSAYWDVLCYTPPSNNPIQLSPAFVWSGSAVAGSDFGYFRAPFSGKFTAASASLQTPAVGGSGVQIDIVNSADNQTFTTVLIPAGSYFAGSTFAAPLGVVAGDYVRSRFTQVGTGTVGANLVVNYNFVANS